MVKKMGKLHWFPMEAGKWLSGTTQMTNAEKGAYIDLLCLQWENGSLEGLPDRLPIRYVDEWPYLKSKFELNGDGNFVNAKLDIIRLEKEEMYRKQSEGGKRGYEKKRKSLDSIPTRSPTHILDIDKEVDKDKEVRDRIIKSYHAICQSLPTIRKLSKKRLSMLNARLKEYPDEQFWVDYFHKVEESDFLTGRGGTWRAGFDWLFNEGNILKVLEGNYNNKRAGNIMDVARELQEEMAND